MRMTVAVWVLLVIGCELEPGETRCSSVPIGDTYVTKCKTRPHDPAPVPQQQYQQQPAYTYGPGWWCAVRPDGNGGCFRHPGICEDWRHNANAVGGIGTYGPCFKQQQAICSGPRCFPNPTACAGFERTAGRSAVTCVAAE